MNDLPPAAGVVARLEARVARLTAVTAFLSLTLAALAVWEFLPRPEGLDARRFVLRDGYGRRRAEVGFRDDGSPGIKLLDGGQQTRLALYLGGNAEGTLFLRDAQGRERLRLALLADGTPVVALEGEGGARLVELRGEAGDRAGLRLRDASGSDVLRLP